MDEETEITEKIRNYLKGEIANKIEAGKLLIRMKALKKSNNAFSDWRTANFAGQISAGTARNWMRMARRFPDGPLDGVELSAHYELAKLKEDDYIRVLKMLNGRQNVGYTEVKTIIASTVGKSARHSVNNSPKETQADSQPSAQHFISSKKSIYLPLDNPNTNSPE